MRAAFAYLTDRIREETQDYYQDRLVSLVVYGSVGRGTPRPDSDIDLLLVVDPLPRGRMARVEEFAAIERAMEQDRREFQQQGIHTHLSPVFKTRQEVLEGTPLFLDMTEDALILYDREAFFAGYMEQLKVRLKRLGARRVVSGGAWYWDLKPGFKEGDIIEL